MALEPITHEGAKVLRFGPASTSQETGSKSQALLAFEVIGNDIGAGVICPDKN